MDQGSSSTCFDVIRHDFRFLSHMKDAENQDSGFIIMEGALFHYSARLSLIKEVKKIDLKTISMIIPLQVQELNSNLVLAMDFNSVITIYKIPDFAIITQKRPHNSVDISSPTSYAFFDESYKNFYYYSEIGSLSLIKTSDLLSDGQYYQNTVLYQSAAEKVLSAFSVASSGALLLVKTDPILSTPSLDVLSAEGDTNNLDKNFKPFNSFRSQIHALPSDQQGSILAIEVIDCIGIVVIITSKSTTIIGHRTRAFANQGLERLKCEEISTSDTYIVSRGNEVRICLCKTDGTTFLTSLHPRENTKKLTWRRESFGELTLGTLMLCSYVTKDVLLFVSRRQGIYLASLEKRKVIRTLDYKSRTYFDAASISRINQHQLTKVIACGGYSPHLGFLEIMRRANPEGSIKVHRVTPHRGSLGVKDFWFTKQGIMASDIGSLSERNWVYVSFEKTILTTKHAICGLSLGRGSDSYLFIDIGHNLNIVKDGSSTKLLFLPGLDYREKYNICASKVVDASEFPKLIVVFGGHSIQVLDDGVLVSQYLMSDVTIRDICLKRVSETATLLVVSDDSGRVTIIEYSLREQNFVVLNKLQFEINRPTYLCDIECSDERQSPIFVYNQDAVYILNLADDRIHELSLDYNVKLMKHKDGDEYVILTTDDTLVHLSYSGDAETKWVSKEFVMKDWVFTEIVKLENPRYSILLGLSINDRSTIFLFDTHKLEVVDNYKLPDHGLVKRIVKLHKPYEHELLLSFSGQAPDSDCLMVLTIVGNRLRKSGTQCIVGASRALIQAGEKLIHAGTQITTYILEKNQNKRSWLFKACQKPLKGPGPLSLACSFATDPFLVVLNPTSGASVYNLELESKVKTIPINRKIIKSLGYGYSTFLTLYCSEMENEISSINSECAELALFFPNKKPISEMHLIIAGRRKLSSLQLKDLESNEEHSLNDTVTQFDSENGATHSYDLPFEGEITNFRKLDWSQAIVCAIGGLYVIDI